MKRNLYLFFAILCTPHILMGMEEQNSLTVLPVEMIMKIADNCGPIDRTILRNTCRLFRELLSENQQEDAQITRIARIARIRQLTDLVNAKADLNVQRKAVMARTILITGSMIGFCYRWFSNYCFCKCNLIDECPKMLYPIYVSLAGEALICLDSLITMLVYKYKHPDSKYDNRDYRRMKPTGDPDFESALKRLDLSEPLTFGNLNLNNFWAFAFSPFALQGTITDRIARFILEIRR